MFVENSATTAKKFSWGKVEEDKVSEFNERI